MIAIWSRYAFEMHAPLSAKDQGGRQHCCCCLNCVVFLFCQPASTRSKALRPCVTLKRTSHVPSCVAMQPETRRRCLRPCWGVRSILECSNPRLPAGELTSHDFCGKNRLLSLTDMQKKRFTSRVSQAHGRRTRSQGSRDEPVCLRQGFLRLR